MPSNIKTDNRKEFIYLKFFCAKKTKSVDAPGNVTDIIAKFS